MATLYLGPLNPQSQSDAGFIPENLSFAGWTYVSTSTGGYLSEPVSGQTPGDRLQFTLTTNGRVMGVEYIARDDATGTFHTAFRALFTTFETLEFLLANLGELAALINGGADTIWGNDLASTIHAGAGEDFVRAGAGNDRVFGGAGDDQLSGQAGADYLDGGDGQDTVNFITSTGAVTVNLATGRGSGGDADGDTYVSIENIAGGAGDDTLIGNDAANRIDGYSGFDIIYGLGGDDVIDGGSGAAGIGSNQGGNTIFGGDGNDRIDGGNGRTTMFGEAGDDILTARGIADYVDGGDGWDMVNYSGIASTVYVNLATGRGIGGAADGDIYVSIEAVATHTGDDLVIGSETANYVWSGGGNDQVFGLGGDDNLEGFAGDDTLFGGFGDDRLDGGEGNDGLYGEDGNDVIHGGLGNDWVKAGNGNDLISVDAGDDIVDAGDGHDVVFLGQGDDGITLGAGDDRVVFEYGNGRDTIYDFGNGRDVIDFTGTDMTLAALQANAVDTGLGILLQLGSGSIFLSGLQSWQIEWNSDFLFAS